MGRRSFLKTAGLAVSAGVLTPSTDTPAEAGPGSPPRGMTFANLRRGGQDGLAIKTERGLLDVRRAEAAWRKGAPVTIDEVLARGGRELQALLDRAKQAPADFFIAEDKAPFGPCVTSPEKILCVGLNYRKHAAETGAAIPTSPVLFNKYNSSLNGHRGTIQVSKEAATQFDYEVELVGYPKDKQVWLKAGDAVRSSIERLGDLDFTLA